MFNTAVFHPMVVHFPIALILAGFLADLVFLFWKKEVCLSKAGYWLMLLGTLGALAAVLTGLFFTAHPSEGEIATIFERHETGAFTTLGVMAFGWLLRTWMIVKKKEATPIRWVVFALYLTAVASVSFTGFLGGTMVYEYMIGL